MAEEKVKEAPKEEAAEGEEGDAPAKKKLPLKLLIIAGAAAVLVLGGGGTAAFMFLKPKPDEAHASNAAASRPTAAARLARSALLRSPGASKRFLWYSQNFPWS